MIQKKIHFLWLSPKKNAEVERCLKSWHENLKDYEIIEWGPSDFPYNDFLFTREAFSKQKWAFVTDYFRLWVLEKYGGIYLDADVMLNDTFDAFLNESLFIGTEFTDQIAAHVIGAEKGHPFIRKCLNYYENRHFILPDGCCDTKAMPCIITKIFMDLYKYRDELIHFNGKPLAFPDMTIYPDSFFTINTFDGHNVCVHNGLGSWRDVKNENPILENVLESYFLKKFYRRTISSYSCMKKWLYLLLPTWAIVLHSRYRAKIKNNKRVKRIKNKA